MKGIDFLKGFNGLAEDIVLEAKTPEQYRRQKQPKGNIVKFAGVAAVVMLLVGVVAAARLGLIHKSAGISIRHNHTLNDLEDKKVLDIRMYTNLEVVTDRAKFIPVVQDQSYNPETDMNRSSSFVADTGETVYIAKENGELFAFQKETGTAALACSKSGCEHKIEAGGECEANLCVVNARFGGMQYYKGDLYYALSNWNSSILYKMSVDTKTKQYYTSLLGEKKYGGGAWLIHRGYIYFVSAGDGFYRMPVDNPEQKEQLISLPNAGFNIKAYGSYVYFIFSNGEFETFARYNIESGQIEQFTDMTKGYIIDFLVNDKKIYFTEISDSFSTVFCYDTSTGKTEPFLPEIAKRWEEYSISFGDLDYLYVIDTAYDIDVTHRREKSRRLCAYTWDGVFAGEVYSTEVHDTVRKLKPFDIFHYESFKEVGSDSDRIYFLDEIYDTQVDESGAIEKLVEGTGKTVVSYIDKSELSAEGVDLQRHTAGEINYRE